MHTNVSSPQAHGAPGFLPWHRAYILDLERELQAIDPSVALPYWRFDRPAPNLFTLDFFEIVRDRLTATIADLDAGRHELALALLDLAATRGELPHTCGASCSISAIPLRTGPQCTHGRRSPSVPRAMFAATTCVCSWGSSARLIRCR